MDYGQNLLWLSIKYTKQTHGELITPWLSFKKHEQLSQPVGVDRLTWNKSSKPMEWTDRVP